ncbi:MAG: Re/Si-specific NAD(P)(+) transhydrogenase subunit alpha [Alphaproteobacteria bacterium]|nr:Re/Si-specific NAD(P)(+) transhydrogenase subunit alpha [Alphaproteobacteria bacterium]MCL2505966.1 Re/Si-specific NAD(P)(+) transhydrogenase subunit alpha [Alphaproteobacteria bacterium]
MKIALPKERRPYEYRVAVTPDMVKKYQALGFSVAIEAGAGKDAMFSDEMYKAAGASIVPDAAELLKDANIVLKVQRPMNDTESIDEISMLKSGAILIGMLNPYNSRKDIEKYAEASITAMTMEFMPRITRAQEMDVLSSQSNLAGYKAVLDAAEHFGKVIPMMMTAAGTIVPARIFVMGAGVAGLQAIATARRLGAVVSATDVRPSVKEQVESLGAAFVMVENEETKEAETSGGYAKEMSEGYKIAQAQLIAETIKKQDIIICTALIPGRAAPILVNEEMVKTMKPGSVIVDLAVEQGGNCALSEVGQVVEAHGVKIVGHRNMPSRVPTDASALYARNLYNFIAAIFDKETGKIVLDWNDEIIREVTLTHQGSIVHSKFVSAG